MSKAAEGPLTFYPAYCFSASPTFNVWVKLTAAGIRTLSSRRGFEGQGIYFYQNHPVQWIQVDDGSGELVEVVLPRKKTETTPLAKPEEAMTPSTQRKIGVSTQGNEIDVGKVEIGEMVKVKGGIREFRNNKQIALERLSDTAAEVQAWEASVAQHQAILSKPWLLTSSRERALRRQAQNKSQRDIKRQGARKEVERATLAKSNVRAKQSSRSQMRNQAKP